MNTIAKILVLAALVWLGWNRPYRDFLSTYFPSSGVTPSRIAVLKAQAASAPALAGPAAGGQYAPVVRNAPQQLDRSWMWDRTSLDRVPGRK